MRSFSHISMICIVLLCCLFAANAEGKGKQTPSLNYYTLHWPTEPLPDNFHKLIILNVSPVELGEKYTSFLTHSLTSQRRCFLTEEELESMIKSFADTPLTANPLSSSGAPSLPYGKEPSTESYIPNWMTTKTYEVLDRKQLQAIIQEVTRSADSLFDKDQELRIGKLAKADGILSLSVEIYNDGTDDTTQTAAQRLTKSYTISRTVDIGVTLMVTSVETGAIIKTSNVQSVLPLRQQISPLKPTLTLPSKEAMMEFAFRRAVDKLANEIAPYLELNMIELVDVDKVATTVEQDAHEDAVKYELKALTRAYCGFKSLYDNSGMNSAPASYNLGCLNLVYGNYDSALEQFTIADDINAKEKRYREAARHTEELVTMKDYYILAGMDPAETKLEEACTEIEIPLILSADVELRGEAAESAEIVGKGVEGNKYVVLEKQDDWVKIKIKRPEAEGWVLAAKLK